MTEDQRAWAKFGVVTCSIIGFLIIVIAIVSQGRLFLPIAVGFAFVIVAILLLVLILRQRSLEIQLKNKQGLEIRFEEIQETSDCVALYLSGYVDDNIANYFQNYVSKTIESGYRNFIFSLADFNFVSDTIVGCFAAFRKYLMSHGGDLVIIETPPKVYEIFQLLGFCYFFNMMDTLNDAIEFFKQPGPFPRIFKCSWCSEKLKSTKAEIIRCPKCLIEYAIDKDGQISTKDAMNNNEIVPGFDIEKPDNFAIRLQKIEEVPGCLILWLARNISEDTKTYFQKQIHKVVEAGFIRLIFPLFEYTEYQVPSKEFVSAFVDLSKTVRSKGGNIVLVENPPTVYDLFLQLGFAQFVHNRKNLEEAVAFFNK